MHWLLASSARLLRSPATSLARQSLYATNSVIKEEPIPRPIGLIMDIKRWQAIHRKQIREYLEKNQISEALTYFYSEVKEPSKDMYSLLLAEIGPTGHTKLAFKLLKEMRSRDMRPSPASLTCLFNSCAMNTEHRDYALSKARNLYEQVKVKGWNTSAVTYHSMIKAFAFLGEAETCFMILDEMRATKHAITADTYEHLLMACAGDKETGFVLAMRVIRLMLYKRVKPTKNCYDHLLRAALDCGCGETVDVLNSLLDDAKRTQLKSADVKLISDGANLLDTRVDDSIVSVSKVPSNISEKMMLIGGCKGILTQMDYFNNKADGRTYSLLLRTVSTEEEMAELLGSIKSYQVDIGFYNQLLKKCILTGIYPLDKAKALLDASDLEYDILTYGILAMGVQTPKQCDEFLSDLRRRDMSLNEIIVSTLINNMARKRQGYWIEKLLAICCHESIPLNDKAVKQVAFFLEKNTVFEYKQSIGRLLHKVRFIKENKNRFTQFEPTVAKRDRTKWDPEGEDDESTQTPESAETMGASRNGGRHRRSAPTSIVQSGK